MDTQFHELLCVCLNIDQGSRKKHQASWKPNKKIDFCMHTSQEKVSSVQYNFLCCQICQLKLKELKWNIQCWVIILFLVSFIYVHSYRYRLIIIITFYLSHIETCRDVHVFCMYSVFTLISSLLSNIMQYSGCKHLQDQRQNFTWPQN